MIKGAELSGRPVLRRDGQKLDEVRGVVADQLGRRLLAITVQATDGDTRAIPFSGIERIGPDAVLVSSGVEGMPVRAWPEVAVILEQRPYRGRSVVTIEGQQVGRLVDVCFDEKTGEVTALEVSGGALEDLSAGRSLIPAWGCTFGEVVIIEPEALKQADRQGGLNTALARAGEAVQGAAGRVSERVSRGVSGVIGTARERLEDNQKRFVLGRTAASQVSAPDGSLIVPAGAEITDEDAERARSAGVLQALFLSAGGAALRDALGQARDRASRALGRLRPESPDADADVEDGSGLEPSPALEATLGYTASRTVNGADGSPIVGEGEVVTEDAIKRAARERFESDLVNAVFGELNPMPSFEAAPDEPKADPAPLTLDTEGNPNVSAEEESRLRLAVGQPLRRAVFGADGKPIVQPGDVVTTELIERGRAEGLLPELTAALEDGESEAVGEPPEQSAAAMPHMGAMDGQVDRSTPAADLSRPGKGT